MSTVEENRFADLDFTRDVRKKIIAKLTTAPDGQFIVPDDPKIQNTVLKALDGVDKGALGRERIKVEDKAATSNANTAAMIAEMYREMATMKHPLIDPNAPPRPAPQLPPDLGEPDLVPDETAVAPAQLSYTTFTAQMGASQSEAPD